MRNPLPVSILIPVRNGAAHLEEAINSAIAQNPAEILICDDGSTDNSREIAESFLLTIHKAHQPGAQAARNHLLSLAREPWVQFLDADDYLMPDKLTQQLAVLKPHQVGYCDMRVHFGNPAISKDAYTVDMQLLDDLHHAFAMFELMPQTNTLLIPRELCPKWRLAQAKYQDHRLVLDLMLAGVEIVHTPFVGCGHRCGWKPTQISSNPDGKREARIAIQEDFYRWIRQAHPEKHRQVSEWATVNQRRLNAELHMGC